MSNTPFAPNEAAKRIAAEERRKLASNSRGLSVRRIMAEQDKLIRAFDATKRGFKERATDYSAEGQKKLWQSHSERFAKAVAQLHVMTDELAELSQDNVAKVRESLFPVAVDPIEKLAAEMEAQRILARGTFNDATELFPYVKSTEPSPARTIVLEELEARGLAKSEYIEGALRDGSAEYQKAIRDHNGIATAINGTVTGRNEYLMECMENWQTPEINNVKSGTHYSDMRAIPADVYGPTADIEYIGANIIEQMPTCDPAYSQYLRAE